MLLKPCSNYTNKILEIGISFFEEEKKKKLKYLSCIIAFTSSSRRKRGRLWGGVLPYHSVMIKFVMRQQLFLTKREVAWQELAPTMSVSNLQPGKYPWHGEGCEESSVLLLWLGPDARDVLWKPHYQALMQAYWRRRIKMVNKSTFSGVVYCNTQPLLAAWGWRGDAFSSSAST